MFDKEIVRCAEKFWRLAGNYEPFPRSLEDPILWTLPVAIVKLPHLGLKEIQRWLQERNIVLDFRTPSRTLRACLIAKAGKGIIFLDGCDTRDEQRLSLAHELAHYLKDYLEPREKAFRSFGEKIRDVLDGVRPPMPEERLAGILKGVPLGVFTDLIERSCAGDVNRMDILSAEDFADQLSLELLAPHHTVVRHLEAHGIVWKSDNANDLCCHMLANDFGLPSDVARKYGDILIMTRRQPRSFREWLGVRSI